MLFGSVVMVNDDEFELAIGGLLIKVLQKKLQMNKSEIIILIISVKHLLVDSGQWFPLDDRILLGLHPRLVPVRRTFWANDAYIVESGEPWYMNNFQNLEQNYLVIFTWLNRILIVLHNLIIKKLGCQYLTWRWDLYLLYQILESKTLYCCKMRMKSPHEQNSPRKTVQ